jgi:mannosyltransferase
MHLMAPITHNKHLILDSTIFDLQQDGGISRYWFELVSNLAARYEEWNLTLLADPLTSNKFGRKLLEVTAGKRNVRLHEYIPSQSGRFFGPRLSDQYKEFLWHSSYYRVPGRLNIPEVCTVQDFILERYFSGAYAWLQHQKKRRAIQRARQIICASEATKRDLMEFYPRISDSDCHVVHHGLSDAFYRTSASPAVDQRLHPYVLFVGSRAKYKNFRLTVLSVEAVPGLALYVVGGKRPSKDELTLLKVHLPNRYRIFDAPPDDYLRDLYGRATALTYLSRYEGFGFPPLEAMACGCPVIAMATSSIPEVVGDGGILLSSEDPAVVAEAIRAVEIPERRLGLIDRGIKRAQQFTWNRTADKTVAVYERAIASASI